MDSTEDVSHNEVKNFNEELVCQQAKMCDYQKEELNLFNEKMTIKYELLEHQKRFNEFQRWKEETNINLKQTNTDYLSIKDCVLKKLEKLKLTETLILAEYQKLDKDNNCLKDRLKELRLTEKKLVVDIEKLETYKTNLEKEYDNQNQLLKKSRSEVEKLARQLKRKHDEAIGAREQLEECQMAIGRLEDRCEHLEADAASAGQKLDECRATGRRLDDRCRELKADAECTRSAREDAQLCAAAAEARLKAETCALADRLECRARELQDAEAGCGEATRRAADQRCRASRSKALAAELRAACEREQREADERERRLERDACRRAADALRLGEQLAAARKDGDVAAREAAAYETRALAYEKVLDSLRQSADARDAVHDQERERSQRDVAALSCEAQRKAAALAELECRAGKLRDEIDWDSGRHGARP